MDVRMTTTIIDSLNSGRTQQEFLTGQRYDVPSAIARRWIELGGAVAVSPAATKGKE